MTHIEPRRQLADGPKLPTGVSALPNGVKHCTVDGSPGYSGDGDRCWPHDGTQPGMQAALANARQDVTVTHPVDPSTGIFSTQRLNETRRYDAHDPLAVEQRAHAETKRQLGQVSRRCLELHEKAKRQLSAEAIDALIEEGIERGRVWPDDREAWVRKFEESPSEAIVELATPGLSGPLPARMSAADEDEPYEREFARIYGEPSVEAQLAQPAQSEEEAAYRREMSVRHKMRPKDVI